MGSGDLCVPGSRDKHTERTPLSYSPGRALRVPSLHPQAPQFQNQIIYFRGMEGHAWSKRVTRHVHKLNYRLQMSPPHTHTHTRTGPEGSQGAGSQLSHKPIARQNKWCLGRKREDASCEKISYPLPFYPEANAGDTPHHHQSPC